MADNETEQVMNVIKAGVAAHQSLMLVGDPGKGKSAVVRQLADDMGYGLITIVGSQRDATDITGFPRIETVDDGNGHMIQVQSYAIPNWQYRIMTEKKIVLFLDEYSNSNPAVQASMLCLLNEREFANGDKMPDETVIIGAMNPVSSAANGFELSLPTCNRLMFIPWEPSDESWKQGLVNNWGHPERISPEEMSWRKRIVDFLTDNGDLIYKLPQKNRAVKYPGIADSETSKLDIAAKAYPTNRSWTNLARVIPSCRDSNGRISLKLIEKAAFGMIGYEATNRFRDYIEHHYKKGGGSALPRPQQVIDNPSIVDWRSVNALQATQLIGSIMQIAEQDRTQVVKVIDLFVYIQQNRGTDLCAKYVGQLMKLASYERLTDEIGRLQAAYRSAFMRK